MFEVSKFCSVPLLVPIAGFEDGFVCMSKTSNFVSAFVSSASRHEFLQDNNRGLAPHKATKCGRKIGIKYIKEGFACNKLFQNLYFIVL